MREPSGVRIFDLQEQAFVGRIESKNPEFWSAFRLVDFKDERTVYLYNMSMGAHDGRTNAAGDVSVDRLALEITLP